MATVTRSRSRVKPSRTIRVALPPSEVNPFHVIRITVGTQAADYCVRPIETPLGRAVAVEKIGGSETYHVLLAHDGHCTCDCKGYTAHHHCKHAGGLTALVRHGRL